jgi:hypothetical protein
MEKRIPLLTYSSQFKEMQSWPEVMSWNCRWLREVWPLYSCREYVIGVKEALACISSRRIVENDCHDKVLSFRSPHSPADDDDKNQFSVLSGPGKCNDAEQEGYRPSHVDQSIKVIWG